MVPFWIGRERHFRCPLTFVTELSWKYIEAFSFYEKKSYPNGLAWGKESHKYLQAMAILENSFNKARNEELERGTKNARR